MYQVKKVVYEDVDVNPDDLVSVLEASKMLGMTMPGVSRAIDRGALREVIDPDGFHWRGRRFLLREDVERFKLERGQRMVTDKRYQRVSAESTDARALTPKR